MEHIVPPVRPQDEGPAAANLQQALLFVTEQHQLKPNGATAEWWRQALSAEVAARAFGERTGLLFYHVLVALHLPPTEYVDAPTAERLNAILEELGAFAAPEPPPPVPEPPPPVEPDGFVVQGRVRGADGAPAVGQLVRAFDKDLRKAEPLGEAATDGDGRYRIGYTAARFARDEKQRADLLVQVGGEGETPLASSPIVFNAPPVATIDVVLGDGEVRLPSEYEVLLRELRPLLQGLTVADLTEDERHQDISFLASETDQDWERIELLVLAHRVARDAHLAASACYGCFRQGLPTDPAQLQIQDPTVLRRALEWALDSNVVPAELREQIDLFLEGLRSAPVRQPVFLTRPDVLFGSLVEAGSLSEEETAYLAARLNARLRAATLEAIGATSARMRRELLSALAPVDYHRIRAAALAEVARDAVASVARRNRDLAEEAFAVQERLAGLPPTPVASVLSLDAPLRENPIFADDVRRVLALEFARLARAGDRVAQALAERSAALAYPDDSLLDELVAEGALTEAQRRALRLVVELAKLTADNLPLVSALQATGADSVAAFAAWEREDWLQRIVGRQVPLPRGETAESYAEILRSNVERTFPTQALAGRLTGPKALVPVQLLDSLEAVLQANGRLIDGGAPAPIDWDGVGPAEREPLRQGLADLTALANTYRHLGVADLVNDKGLSLAARKQAVSGRIALLDTLFAQNPELDLRRADLSAASTALLWGSIPAAERPLVRKQLMAYQRTLSLTDEADVGRALLRAGYDSALAIAETSEDEFIAVSGLDIGTGHSVREGARLRYQQTGQAYGAITNVVQDATRNAGMVSIGPDLINDLREIDGFDDLFGPQNYCDCAECKSIFSPAAYFVDLMHFIDKHVSKKYFASRPSHPLYLKRRRGDLWSLRLTCENTHTLIPYLTIVNEVLETYLESIVGEDIYDVLSRKGTKLSFSLPFMLPLEELRLHLGHFGLAPHDIYRLLQHPVEKVLRARLGLSRAEFDVIAQSDPAGVRHRLGDPPSIANFDVQDFVRLAGVSREQLGELLALRFNPDLGAVTVATQFDADQIQIVKETLSNLTNQRLDFIHRFVRLWRKTRWSIPDLDMVLVELRDADLITGLDATTVRAVAQVVDVQEGLALSVEEVCALFHDLPVSRDFPVPPARQADRRLYERLFDLPKLFGEDPATHVPAVETDFYHYSLDTSAAAAKDKHIDPKTPALLGGLGVTETELLQLFDLLREAMPFSDDGKTKLDRRRISLLYRHARLAKALRLSVDDCIQALRLHFPPDDAPVTTFAQIEQLREFRAWLRASPFSVSELRLILKGEASALVAYKTDVEAVAALVWEIQQAEASGALASLAGEAEQAQESPRLTALRARLAQSFNLTRDRLDKSLRWIAGDIKAGAIEAALTTPFTEEGAPVTPGDLDPLLSLMQDMERVLLLFGNLRFRGETVDYVTDHAAALGIADLAHVTLDDLKALTFYKQQIVLGDGAEPYVQAVLDSYQAGGHFAPADVSRLADLWNQDATLIESLANSLAQPAAAIDAVEYLWRCLGVCRTLGINGYSLQILGRDGADDTEAADSDIEVLRAARDVALGAFSSKYDDEKVRQEKLEPYQDQTNVKKRDALCDYTIARQKELKFKDLQDLYAFFLLDVEMSGCFRTSRLVCAISSLQLYVHRCLINLEQSDEHLNPAIENVHVLPDDDMVQEWEWRKNYRVWEANRKVFLYPENYIEPDLRDNKTPLFKQLEEELLQEKITKEAAEAAYRKYVTQFAELARLVIAGSYRYRDTDQNATTYYFFGRTQQDPPQYYYRTWDFTEWTPWEKIDLSISAPHVAALVLLGKLYLFWAEITTREKHEIEDGKSNFIGYESDLSLMYSFKSEDHRWVPSQRLPIHKYTLDDNTWRERVTAKVYRRIYPWTDGQQKLFYRYYNCAFVDGQIEGVEYGKYGGRLNLFLNRLQGDATPAELGSGVYLKLCREFPEGVPEAALVGDQKFGGEPGLHELTRRVSETIPSTAITKAFDDDLLEADLDIVHNTVGEYVLKLGSQQYLVRRTAFSHAKRRMLRLGTSLADELGDTLFGEGLEAFLSLDTQRRSEHDVGIVIKPDKQLELQPPVGSTEHVDFVGSYGEYYRELFFHVPFLIANHLNANQRFEEAKWWYERIFDPTAVESPEPQPATDRNWRYIEFRGATVPKLKAILSDPAAISEYEDDPFNPHAIARLRMSAYQKAIVMKYIDNLLDWGDHLFAQDTMESINEATMLYVLAADILGKRPAELGPCKTASDAQLTYGTIGPAIKAGEEILITLENYVVNYVFAAGVAQAVAAQAGAAVHAAGGAAPTHVVAYREAAEARSERLKPTKVTRGRAGRPGRATPGPEVAKSGSTLVFCVPPNDTLLGYWDRVADRLYKIRHCMNISGVRRTLALFQPPIDPMTLVRARAAGLSLEEILAMGGQAPPPYRFSSLVEKAKQYTQAVQSFGGALLSALEKKDVEELTLLRSVHERTILRLTRQIKRDQVREAQYQQQALVETKTNVQNRIDYYTGLVDEGLISPENAEQISQAAATTVQAAGSAVLAQAAISYLIPQVGSPFSLKYGGKEQGDSFGAFGALVQHEAAMLQTAATANSLMATFDRREQEWSQQLALAQQELKQVEQQRLAAEVRALIAEKDLESHEKAMEQADELHDFYKDKFTNLGLYTYLATTLTRLYREAYNVAYDLSRMAERAYRFERDDDTFFIAGDNWRFDRAGLLAGEHLLLQLQQLERTYLEQHTRDYEVTQSFSLALLDPEALVELRQAGTCEFTVPEILFDLSYPGQYRRLIKSVRLTIPCVAGPYTNVGAKLTLTGGKVRKEPTSGLEAMSLQLPTQPSIATSTAQNDGGLFELSFRDERYLPFEGAGAADSTWRLDLPATLRPFDYDTIADVILHISYTARDNSAYREEVEQQIKDALSALAASPGLFRLLSLKHEFPDAFYHLLHPSAPTQTAEFTITGQHFPYFLGGGALALSSVTAYLIPKEQEPVSTAELSLKINDAPFDGWSTFVGNVLEASGALAGTPFRKWTIDAGAGGLDPEALDDILLLVRYSVTFDG
jgi:hypothetical protein